MFYLHTSRHQEFRKCRASIDKDGRVIVWIGLEDGGISMDVGDVDGLINALSDALTEARLLESERVKGGANHA